MCNFWSMGYKTEAKHHLGRSTHSHTDASYILLHEARKSCYRFFTGIERVRRSHSLPIRWLFIACATRRRRSRSILHDWLGRVVASHSVYFTNNYQMSWKLVSSINNNYNIMSSAQVQFTNIFWWHRWYSLRGEFNKLTVISVWIEKILGCWV